MILVGLEKCKGCEILHKKHPEVPYVEVPRIAGNSTQDVLAIKLAIGRLGIKEFPVLLDDALVNVLPLTLIDPNVK
jgi:hypothetical protein